MIVYKITNLINNKIYIGQTVRTLEARWKAHKSDRHAKNNRPICRALRKYGVHNFIIDMISIVNSKEEMDEVECFWIKELDSMNPKIGYNARAGGNMTTFSTETKQKMSLAKKGKLGNRKNFPCSKETATKIGLANKGKTAWNKGSSLTQEQRKKHGEVRKGMKAWNRGIKLNLKPIIAINLSTMEEFEFLSIHDVVIRLNVGRCAVQNVLSGRGKRTSNNFTYKYKDK